MSEIKRTPWEVFQNGFSMRAVKDADGNWLTYAAGDDRRMSREEVEANARLMAAAPDLLEALRDLIGWVPGPDQWHTDACPKAVERAIAAIAKATGGAQ